MIGGSSMYLKKELEIKKKRIEVLEKNQIIQEQAMKILDLSKTQYKDRITYIKQQNITIEHDKDYFDKLNQLYYENSHI